jgi:hypothetical protein
MKVTSLYDEGFGLFAWAIEINVTFFQQDLRLAFYSSKKDLGR